MAWGLLVFVVWVIVVVAACAFLGAATRKPTPRSDFQQWENER